MNLKSYFTAFVTLLILSPVTEAKFESDNFKAIRGLILQPNTSFIFDETSGFEQGNLINVISTDGGLKLIDEGSAFNFIWVAASARGTVVKIDTKTGVILGEYRTYPTNGNPSRTTVDKDGSVWVANRDSYPGSVVHIGLLENGQCEDRNRNGMIDTSTGLSDIKSWSDLTGDRRIDTAMDECILSLTEVSEHGTRHVSVDADNNVWVSGIGTGSANFDLVKGDIYNPTTNSEAGKVIKSYPGVGYGGYGGLIDRNGVLWSSSGSSSGLLRWDLAKPLTGENGDPPGESIGPIATDKNWAGQAGIFYYGICLDISGNIWVTDHYDYGILKFASNGEFIGRYSHGMYYSQGCAVDKNDHVWVAGSLYDTKVSHLLNNGTLIGTIEVGNGPTGVAVDGSGKIWATNTYSNNAVRIDTTLGELGSDGITPIGAVELAVSLGDGANPYNYGDMTGSTITAAPRKGSWTIIVDSGLPSTNWSNVIVSFESSVPNGSSLKVTAASSEDNVDWNSQESLVLDGSYLEVLPGRYLRHTVLFERMNSTAKSPTLSKLIIGKRNNLRCSEKYRCKNKLFPGQKAFSLKKAFFHRCVKLCVPYWAVEFKRSLGFKCGLCK